MDKKTKIVSEEKEALQSFDVDVYAKWLNKYNKPMYKSYMTQNKATRIMCMCKRICDRTDMFNTEAHKKAVKWLKEHNTKGKIF